MVDVFYMICMASGRATWIVDIENKGELCERNLFFMRSSFSTQYV